MRRRCHGLGVWSLLLHRQAGTQIPGTGALDHPGRLVHDDLPLLRDRQPPGSFIEIHPGLDAYRGSVGAMVMTAWDLVMDPMMVAGGHWVWEEPGAYFGIPLQNYVGWFLTTFITFWLFLTITRIRPRQDPSNDSFNQLPILSYAILGLSTILTDFLFGLGGPALVGIFAMLPWVLLGWWK